MIGGGGIHLLSNYYVLKIVLSALEYYLIQLSKKKCCAVDGFNIFILQLSQLNMKASE